MPQKIIEMIFCLFCMLCLVVPVSMDIWLNQVQPGSSLGQAPKMWHTFVKMFLQTFFERKSSLQNDVSSQSLSKISEKCSKFLHQFYGFVYQMIFPEKSGPCLNNNTATRPSATLLSTDAKNFRYYSKDRTSSFCNWHFNLNPLWSLNITFVSVNFSFENLLCTHARMNIYEGHKPTRQEQSKLKFEYCGIYTLFNVYPKNQLVWIQVDSTRLFYFIVHALYTTISTKLIRTCFSTKMFSSFPPVDYVILMQTNISVHFHLIVVQKSAVVVLNRIVQCELSAHDGPDVHADRITSQKKTFHMSTFQCFMVTKCTGILECAVVFGKQTQKGKSLSLKHDSNMILPFNDCLCTPKMCLSSITHHKKNQINATLFTLSFSNKVKSPNCRHGGFIVLEGTFSLHN